MRTPKHSLPSVFLYSFGVTITRLGILLTILALISNLIMGPLLTSELLIFGLFLTSGLETKNQGPQVAGMRTGLSSCSALIVCPVLILLLLAVNLNKAL